MSVGASGVMMFWMAVFGSRGAQEVKEIARIKLALNTKACIVAGWTNDQQDICPQIFFVTVLFFFKLNTSPLWLRRFSIIVFRTISDFD
jgi:hypothetical protein